MVDFNNVDLNDNRILFGGVLVAIVIVAVVGAMFLLPLEEPEPPEEKPYTEGMYYDYTEVTFSYSYGGPEDPKESEQPIPERVILHTTEEITEETRLHEFNPTYRGEEQTHTIDLKELAEDPSDHLRTHPEINMTVVYSNGARETAITTIEPENIGDIIYANYQTSDMGNGSVSITFSEIAAQQVEVEAPNNSYTVSEDGSQVIIEPEDYYIDEDDDGVYEQSGSVHINKQYYDVSETLETLEPQLSSPSTSLEESNREDHFVLNINNLSSDYDSFIVTTPEGNYIEEEHYNPESGQYEGDRDTYIQTAEGVGQTRTTTLTIKDEAQLVEIYVERNGNRYIVESLNRDN